MKQPDGEKRWARSACPRCGATAPLKLIVAGRGKTFDCKGCNAALSTSKLGTTLIVSLTLLGTYTAKSFGIPFIVVMLLASAAAIVEWGMLRIYLIDERLTDE